MPSEPFLIHSDTTTYQYLTLTIPRHPKNERVKTSAGSKTASGYARTWSDCIYFCLHIMMRPIDALGAVFDAVGHPSCPIFDPDQSKTHKKISLSRQMLGQKRPVVMPEPGRTASIFVYIL